jgi:hypothetical protein
MMNGNKSQAFSKSLLTTALSRLNATQRKFNPIQRVTVLFEHKNVLLFTLFILLLLSWGTLSAQAVSSQIGDVVMPSPNAASLGKYGDIPVSYNTGIPSIGIPIHTLSEGSISLPISLSYHAGGLKVGEPCSWAGLGWSLQAGGMISRTVQGRADESCGGFFDVGKDVAVTTGTNPNGSSTTCIIENASITNSELANGAKDGEPDIFSFSIGGYSGKFYIAADLTPDGIKWCSCDDSQARCKSHLYSYCFYKLFKCLPFAKIYRSNTRWCEV